MVVAYLDELNAIVNRTSTSSAHQERVFIDARLADVKAKLERAQEALSEFSSKNSTIDLREQTRATVESEAKVQGELIAAQSELASLRQVYGDSNVRVRAAEARASILKGELEKMGGSASPLPAPTQDTLKDGPSDSEHPESYLPLRQVPRLAVPYANLLREVRVQEAVYDLLTQQVEVARIQEAKDVPAVNIIDAPGIPEKKSFPPRALLTLAFTLLSFLAFSAFLIFRDDWRTIRSDDPRKTFAIDVMQETRGLTRRALRFNRRAK
jgi:capsule polysaccharide export protein KpsE/RkpR